MMGEGSGTQGFWLGIFNIYLIPLKTIIYQVSESINLLVWQTVKTSSPLASTLI